MGNYGKLFAAVYNQQWAGFAQHVSPPIREYYEQQPVSEQHRTVLDVCCGTGQLLRHFLERGYEGVGLDQSPPMLGHAQENAAPYIKEGKATFVQADASHFRLDRQFGLAVSTFDALNHLPDEAALRGCFRSAQGALVEAGVFIFDLNTRRGLEKWNGVQVFDTDSLLLVNRGIYDGGDRAYTRITGCLQRPDGLYERFAETFSNTVFDLERVQTLLVDEGFSDAHIARLNNLAAPVDDPESLERAFFVARK